MSSKLRDKTIAGLFWSFAERIGQQGIQFVISIILARLLAPAEFGLIAMLTIFMAVAQSFMDSGFGNALIQKQNATHVDECSIFYFNIFMGVIATGLLWAAAPWIAAFYNMPLLTPLTRVLSFNLLINSFGLIQTMLLTKRIDFKAQMKVNVAALVISGSVGVTMAYHGFGVWSLVAQSLISNIFRTMFLWFIIRWRPSLIFSFASLQTMFAFGSKLLLSGLLDTIYKNLWSIIIGKVYSPSDLGFYTRARSLEQIPTHNLTSSVARVTFPTFATMQDDKPRLKRSMRRALMTLALGIFPMMIGLAAVSKPLMIVLLTDKWLPSVPYLQLLCVIGIMYPLQAINLNVLTALGRSDLFLWVEVLKKIQGVSVLFITYRWGISAMIIGGMFTSCSAYCLNSYYTGKLLTYPAWEQLRDLVPSFMLAAIMGAAVYAISYAPLESPYLLLAVQVPSGVFIYLTLCLATQHEALMAIINELKPRLLKLRKAM